MNVKLIVSGFCIFLGIACSSQKEEQKTTITKKPNIIYLLADDLGYGDLSCYGQQKFETPHIDQLAATGMKFTQHYAGNTVCAPSRSCLLTGQHTGHTPIRGNKEVQPEGQYPLPDSIVTLGEVLKQAGYVTGAFGKWGLGAPGSEGDPNQQGFDQFFGYNCQRLAHNYYPWHLWENQNKIMLKDNEGENKGVYAPNLIQEKAMEFIEQNKDTSFFLYVPFVMPHAELAVPEDYVAKYRGKFDPEYTFHGVDQMGEEYFKEGAYGSQPEAHATFAAMVSLLDAQVGEIVDKVKALGLDSNTLIIFSSDNGPHQEGGADPDFFDSNGPLKGYKRDLYEGGIRVPMIASWPGKIQAGSETNFISAFWDILPTVMDITGVNAPGSIDGVSFLPTLLDKGNQTQHDYLYWEFHEKGGRVAIRKGKWKAVRYNVLENPDSPLELYDLSADIHEDQNVAEQHPEIVAEMEDILRTASTPSPVFTFDAGTFLNEK